MREERGADGKYLYVWHQRLGKPGRWFSKRELLELCPDTGKLMFVCTAMRNSGGFPAPNLAGNGCGFIYLQIGT